MTQRRIMLASMMDEEEGKTVDSDGSTEGEEEEEEKGRKKRWCKFHIWKLFPKVRNDGYMVTWLHIL